MLKFRGGRGLLERFFFFIVEEEVGEIKFGRQLIRAIIIIIYDN